MTMSGHVHERLSAYLDRELGAAESASVLAHLRDCEPCRQHLEALATVDKTARVLTAEAPEGYFDALPGRVRARLEASSGRWRSVPATRRPARLPAWTWALAAALVLAVITPITLRSRRSAATISDETAVARAAPSAPPLAATPAPTSGEADRDLSTDQPKADVPALRELAASGDGRAQAPANPLAKPAPDKDEMRLAAEPQRAEPQGRKMAGPGGPYQGQVQSQAQGARSQNEAQARAKAEPPQAAPAQAAGAAAENVVVNTRTDEADARAGAAAREEAPAPSPARAPTKSSGARQRSNGFAEAAPPEDEDRLSPEEAAYRRLLAPTPATRAALRERREAWRAFERRFPEGPHADEARVRVVETGVAAFRAGQDASDLARAREDAAAYLDRDDASQAARVRAIFRELGGK